MKKLINQEILKKIKSSKKKIVMCHGVFDLFHVGHLNHFKEAKTHGDILIVSVTSDNYVNKGPGRPYFKLNQRLEILSSINLVDFLIVSDSPNSVNNIKKIRPNFYFKGPDYKNLKKDFTGYINDEIKAIKNVKGKIIFGTKETFSSSVLLNQISNFNNDQKKTITNIKKNYKFEEIFSKIIKVINNLNILVIGEIIIDKFIFTNALGKSGKEAILNLEISKEIDYIGGAAAICNNLQDFTKKNELISFIGCENSKLNFIKKELSKKTKLNFFFKKNSQTIVKTKIIDSSTNNKLLGLYNFDDKKLSNKEENTFLKKIKQNVYKNDLVIVSDYGHGFISDKLALILSKQKNIIINTQLNAGNIGYHTISKYKNVQCAIINEVELRHEMRNRYEDIRKLISRLSKKLKIQNLIVTAGKKGSYHFNSKKGKITFCPAFASNVIDKIGSGDAYMAIFSIMNLVFPKDPNISLFLSSLATAQVLEGFGNEKSIKLINLLKSLKYILK